MIYPFINNDDSTAVISFHPETFDETSQFGNERDKNLSRTNKYILYERFFFH